MSSEKINLESPGIQSEGQIPRLRRPLGLVDWNYRLRQIIRLSRIRVLRLPVDHLGEASFVEGRGFRGSVQGDAD